MIHSSPEVLGEENVKHTCALAPYVYSITTSFSRVPEDTAYSCSEVGYGMETLGALEGMSQFRDK